MDITILALMLAIVLFSLIAAFFAMGIFVLIVWSMYRSSRTGETKNIFVWDHKRSSILLRKASYITNSGEPAPMTLTDVELEELRKRPGTKITYIIVADDAPYHDVPPGSRI